MKKFLSLCLALVICLSLAVPVFATPRTTAFPDLFTLDYEGTEVKKDFTTHWSWGEPSSEDTLYSDVNYYTIAKGTKIKATNISKNANDVMVVYCVPYHWRAQDNFYHYDESAGAFRAVKKDGTWLSYGSGLAMEDAFYDNSINPGESVTFTLPDYGDDTLFMLWTWIRHTDRDINDPNYYQWEYRHFLYNTAAFGGGAAAAPAKAPASTPAPAAPAAVPTNATPVIAASNQPQYYFVQKGDTWSSISVNFYGDNSRANALYKANSEALKATKGKLTPGMTVTLPATLNKRARLAIPTAAAGEKLYTVQRGDTLSKIAKAQLGSANYYKNVFERNKDRLKNANRIFAGQVIVIPVKPAKK